MGKHRIEIRQSFAAPLTEIFSALTDHVSFGEIIGKDIVRIVDSPDENKNGVGSVRRIRSFPVPAFEETVVTYVPNELMEYVVSKGSPIKNHRGRMVFAQEQSETRLDYTIEFEPKLPFILLGSVLKQAISKPIRKGIERFAAKFSA
jgi:hypothetical protein